MTSWPASVRRRVVALVETIASAVEMRGGNVILGMSLEPLAVAEAQSLLPKLRERKAPAKRLPGESKAAKRERRRAEHREETARIRDACLKRCEGKCEICGGAETTFMGRLEMHHLLGGVGRRRQKQAVENCIMVCTFCHGMLPNAYAACAVEAWCKKHGYPIPAPVAKHVAQIEAEQEAAGAAHRAGAREGT